MSDTSISSGRTAAMTRRRALAEGKAALPPARERVRTGFREAALREPASQATFAAPPPPAQTDRRPDTPGASAAVTPSLEGLAGRLMSMLRRRQQSAGKTALAPVKLANPATHAQAQDASSPAPVASCDSGSCREQARARRTEMARVGRGSAPAARPSRPVPQGQLEYPAKVLASPTPGGRSVTGLHAGRGTQVTGVEAGAWLQVSGTGCITGNEPNHLGGTPPKVGVTRTEGGNLVTGSQVRSAVPVTGDEAGGGKIRITGEADNGLADDLTTRPETARPAAQFNLPRRSGPGAFASNAGGSASAGSRQRERQPGLETTHAGQTITGTATGRSVRVTGNAAGACRAVTGDQYLAPAARATECGGRGGGFAPPEHLGAARRDPVTGAKVTEAQTWGAQRVTGPNVEHRRGVTGDEPGTCRLITGTPYQGPSTAYAWCTPEDAEASARRLERRACSLPVTGDLPGQDPSVTGMGRGAGRSITGAAYERTEPQVEAPAAPVADIDARFSVSSPQRRAQLAAVQRATGASAITGSFAAGQNKITGNAECSFIPRGSRPDEERKRTPITGEGRVEGMRITGDAWANHERVTGTEGVSATCRNPSDRAGKPHAFASSDLFKNKGHHEEPKKMVTGMVGWSAKSAAKVTLSGGAQG